MTAQPFPTYFDWSEGSIKQSRGTHVVYILEFEGGIVKVGQTRDLDTRITGHCSSPRTRGRKLLRYWAVEREDALLDEATILEMVRDTDAARWMGGREWFDGVDFLALIDKVSTVLGVPDYRTNKYRPDLSGMAEYNRMWDGFFESIVAKNAAVAS